MVLCVWYNYQVGDSRQVSSGPTWTAHTLGGRHRVYILPLFPHRSFKYLTQARPHPLASHVPSCLETISNMLYFWC